MRVFNRVVMIVGILLLIALVAYIMILPPDAVYFAQQGLDSFRQWLVTDQSFYVFPIAGGVLLLILLILLWLEIRRPRRKTVRIGTNGNGDAQLGVHSVAQSLEYRIDELAGVRKVVSRIISRGKDVEVYLDLDTSPSVNIPVLTDQIVNLVHDIVEGQLGIKIHGKVGINIKHEPYPRGTMPPVEPLGAKPVVAPPQVATATVTSGSSRRPAPAKAASQVEETAEAVVTEEVTSPPVQEVEVEDDLDEEENSQEREDSEDRSSAW